METGYIKTIEAEAAVLPVSQFPWGKDYCPLSWAKIWFEPGSGFHVLLHCEESSPKAVFTCSDDPVYQDSCLECFLQFYPEQSEVYMNFETNANGAMLCQQGTCREDRIFIRNQGMKQPAVTAFRTAYAWEVSYVIPLELIRRVYGRCDFVPGQVIRGNFYKCGDKTEIPHYGCWSKIGCSSPDYHRPEYFGELIMA